MTLNFLKRKYCVGGELGMNDHGCDNCVCLTTRWPKKTPLRDNSPKKKKEKKKIIFHLVL